MAGGGGGMLCSHAPVCFISALVQTPLEVCWFSLDTLAFPVFLLFVIEHNIQLMNPFVLLTKAY